MKAAKRFHDTGHGILKEVATEKEVLEITTCVDKHYLNIG
jgi:hypothetical protein